MDYNEMFKTMRDITEKLCSMDSVSRDAMLLTMIDTVAGLKGMSGYDYMVEKLPILEDVDMKLGAIRFE